MKISIIGLGYVGFPLAIQAASKGYNITGVEKNSEIVQKLEAGLLHISDEFILSKFTPGCINVTAKVETSDVYIICVPTPVNNIYEPDLSYVINAVEEIASVLENEQLIIIESTINPGISEEIVYPILKNAGKKFYLAHCPERINPGDKKWNVSNINRIVGGIDQKSTELAYNLYKSIIDADVMPLRQIKAAEATKILENTFRDINIAFINEMSKSFHKLGINIKEVIEGASTKPFAFIPHYPGLGVGGHCIAVDPYYMIKRGKEVGFNHDFLSLAREINKSMPLFTLEIIQDALNMIGLALSRSNVVILGLSYKPNVADDRESPAYDLIRLLREKGCSPQIFDPFFLNKSSSADLNKILIDVDCTVIATAHDAFLNTEIYSHSKIVIDGRNCLDPDVLKQKGIVYRGIGISEFAEGKRFAN